MTVYIGPTTLDSALTKLGQHIRSGHDPASNNMPVGVKFTVSGVLYLTYSLDAPRKVDNTATAAMLIEDYLKGQETL